jgi:hypothetical protein
MCDGDGYNFDCDQSAQIRLAGCVQSLSKGAPLHILAVTLYHLSTWSYLKSLGFSGVLQEALNAAERDFRDSATPFELKSSLAHLRSFLEGLHEQACSLLAAKMGAVAPKKWGKTTEMGTRRNHECHRWPSSGYNQRRRAGRHSDDRQP